MHTSNPSVMVHQFSQVPKAEIPRSTFDRTHGHKTTIDAGLLIPFFVDEVLPGDTFNVDATLFARLATPIFPLMDNMYLDTHYFAVPNRLVWDNWKKFNGEQTNPGDSTDFVIPTITSTLTEYTVGTIYDYMGLPVAIAGIKHSALFLRAYNLIWNEWFRDQNMQNSLTVPKTDGPDAPTLYTLQRRGKRHDYFTSALPFPQKGASVTIPLGGTANVVGNGVNAQGLSASDAGTRNILLVASGNGMQLSGTAVTAGASFRFPTLAQGATGLVADLANAGAASINQLRQSFQIQKMLERDARGGTRYTEVIRAHFGVTSPDARLQRPEYLGGGSSQVGITPVPSTAPTSGVAPQGNLAGFGTVLAHGHGFNRSFTEHCVIIGLCSIRADLTYQRGVNRMWYRTTRYDFYWPALSHIGEQIVMNGEIWTQGTAADLLAFGYQERYAEYRYKPSLITGRLNSGAVTPLDAWHLAQSFGSLPTLNATFIVENPPIARVVAVPTQPNFILDCYIRMRCARPMPVYGVPGLIDHF